MPTDSDMIDPIEHGMQNDAYIQAPQLYWAVEMGLTLNLFPPSVVGLPFCAVVWNSWLITQHGQNSDNTASSKQLEEEIAFFKLAN